MLSLYLAILKKGEKWKDFSQKSRIATLKKEKGFPFIIDYHLKVVFREEIEKSHFQEGVIGCIMLDIVLLDLSPTG